MQVLTTAPFSPHRCVLANYDEDNNACKAFEYLKDSNALNSVDSNEEWVRDCMHAQEPFLHRSQTTYAHGPPHWHADTDCMLIAC